MVKTGIFYYRDFVVNAIKSEYPDQEIDYPFLRLSEGTLSIPLAASAESTDDRIKFTWEYDQQDTNGSPTTVPC